MSQGDDLSEEYLIKDTISILNYIKEKYPLDYIIIVSFLHCTLCLFDPILKKICYLKRG